MAGSLRIRSHNFAAGLGLEHEHDNEQDFELLRYPKGTVTVQEAYW
jgi:hypothetical protein